MTARVARPTIASAVDLGARGKADELVPPPPALPAEESILPPSAIQSRRADSISRTNASPSGDTLPDASWLENVIGSVTGDKTPELDKCRLLLPVRAWYDASALASDDEAGFELDKAEYRFAMSASRYVLATSIAVEAPSVNDDETFM